MTDLDMPGMMLKLATGRAENAEARIAKLEAINADLLEALEGLLDIEWNKKQILKYALRREKARAAIAKARES